MTIDTTPTPPSLDSDSAAPPESVEPQVDDAPAEALAPDAIVPRLAKFSDLVLEYGPWNNPRTSTGLDDESMAALAASIREHSSQYLGATVAGINDALTVVRVKRNGDVVTLVIDGQRRYRAANIVFADADGTVPSDLLVRVVDRFPEPVDLTPQLAGTLLMEVLETAATRAGLSGFELSESAERLRGSKNPDNNKEYTLAEIARALGRSESWVSKILKARSHARPSLLHQWSTGQITEEQFKALASQRDPEKQETASQAVVQARQTGSRAQARTLAKEQKETARRTEREAKSQPKPEPKAAATTKSPSKAPKAEPTAAAGEHAAAKEHAKPTYKPLSPAVVDDILTMEDRTPPTHDYVKGVLAGIRYARGMVDSPNLAKPWQSYILHVQGAAKPSKGHSRK